MPLPMPGWYLLYLRKSVGRMGIGRQRTITTSHLARLGGQVASGGEFKDVDSTAYAKPGEEPPPRADFLRLLAEMSRRPGVGVAAWHVDRILRNGEDAAIFTRACVRGGHLVVTARGGTYDMSEANGRKRLRDDASDAEGEVDHNRERVLEKMAELRAEGRWGGGRRPFGFDVNSAAPGGLILRDAEAELVREGTAALLAGATLRSIARDWAAATGDGKWNHVLVRQVLRRPLNVALIGLGGEIAGDGAWPAIITDAAHWRAACAILADPARRTSPGPERRHLLSGVALCGTCGAALGIASTGGRTPCYRCRRHAAGDPRGPHASRSVAHLDAWVTVLALGRLKQDDAAMLLRPDHAASRAALLAGEISQQALWDEQWELYQQHVISARELTEGRARIGADLDATRGQLAALDQADALAPFIADPDGAWQRAQLGQRRAAVRALMHVTVFPARQGRPPGTPRTARWFDDSSVDTRWVTRLPSDG
jgi:site-specific DNA recombinase